MSEPDAFDRWLGDDVGFAEALGQFAMRFAVLEHQMNEVIRELLGLEPAPGAILTSAIQSVSLRLDILEALLDGLKIKGPVGDIRKALATTRSLNGLRNHLLHDRWDTISFNSGEEPLFKKLRYVKEPAKGRKKGNPPFKSLDLKYSKSEVRKSALECWALARRVHKVRKELVVERGEKLADDEAKG